MTGASARQDKSVVIYLCLAGCVLLAFAVAAPWIVRRFGYAVFVPALAASGLVTIFATRCAADVPARTGLMIVLGFALAMRFALVGIEPLLSTDLYRYVWDGRVQAAGINPYRYVPADAALVALRDAAIYPNINRADYAVTAYPPVAEMFFLLISRIAETATMMRLAMVACEIFIVAIVIDLLRRLALPVTTVVAYAWHPLAVFEVANNGHVETLMVALMMLGVWLLMRAQRIRGSIAVTLAALAKPYAVLILPVFWRPWDWRVPLAIVVTILIFYLPYLGVGSGVFGFLGQGYLQEEGFLSGSSIWLVALLQATLGPMSWLPLLYAAGAAAIMVSLGLRYRFDPDRTPCETICAIAILLTAGLVLMSPNYAWYLFALVPFLPLGAGWPAWALTLGAFLLYRPIYLGNQNELIWKSLATIPFVLALAYVLSSKRARNAVA